jgi:hypothetical protein
MLLANWRVNNLAGVGNVTAGTMFRVVVTILAVLTFFCGSAVAQTGVADWDEALRFHNERRASVGAPPLNWSIGLRHVW